MHHKLSLHRVLMSSLTLTALALSAYFLLPNPLKSRAATSLQGDINGDGSVNIFDLSILLSNFGKSITATPTATVSPTTNPSGAVPKADRIFQGIYQNIALGNMPKPGTGGNPWATLETMRPDSIQVVNDPAGVKLPDGITPRKVGMFTVNDKDIVYPNANSNPRAQQIASLGDVTFGGHIFSGSSIYFKPDYKTAPGDQYLAGGIAGFRGVPTPPYGQGPINSYIKRDPTESASTPADQARMIVRLKRFPAGDVVWSQPIQRGHWYYFVRETRMQDRWDPNQPLSSLNGYIVDYMAKDNEPYQRVSPDNAPADGRFNTYTVNANWSKGPFESNDASYREQFGNNATTVDFRGPHLHGKTFDAADPRKAYN